jgi:hypothetical protein
MARARCPGRHEAEHRLPHRVAVSVPLFGVGGRLNERCRRRLADEEV